MVERMQRVWDEGGETLGVFLFTRVDAVVLEAVSPLFDYFVIDLQHGLMDHQLMVSAIRSLHPLSRATALVRPPSRDKGLIGRALDAGAAGVVIPGIESAEEAAEVVRFCRYVPEGERSYGPVGALVRYGLDYPMVANDEVAVIPMIETRKGLENAEEICAVEGVDAIYVGTMDLSISMGLKADTESIRTLHPELRYLAEVALRHGIVPGIHGTNEPTEVYREMGYRMITVTTDFDVITKGFQRAAGLSERKIGY